MTDYPLTFMCRSAQQDPQRPLAVYGFRHVGLVGHSFHRVPGMVDTDGLPSLSLG